ncbi:MAG: P22 coat - protein 5 family protein [Desulfovibrionaceae bacterium]|nr:P22 coat - protein 5 family protein [Desulfovibrionaceae bacterium]MBF0514833.1 P22 coat - protein 5 family protein [Desulfovibrionaceae bacterium]
MANTLTNLIPVIYAGMDMVARELVGFIPAVDINAKAEEAALNQYITVPITGVATTGDIIPGQLPPDDGDQTIGTTQLQITKSKYSPIRWSGEELKGYQQNGTYALTLAQQFAQSMRSLCNLVEIDLAVAAYQGASRACGTPGTAPFGTAGDLSNIAQTRKILEDNGAPLSDLRCVLGTTAAANLRGKQSVLFKVNEAGTDDLLRRGALGELEGFQIGVSAQVQSVTNGNGANYVTSGSTAVGVDSIALVTGTGNVNSGDIVTFAADANNKYVVGTGVTAPGTISLNNPGARMVIPTGNALTIGASYTANMAFHRNAIKLLARVPAMPDGGDLADDMIIISDPISGLSFQVAIYRLYRRIKYEIGLAWGVKVIKSEFVATMIG